MVVERTGIKRYEEIIKNICKVENIYRLSKEEKNSVFGVAIVLSYLDGIIPNIKNMSHHLNLSPFLLEDAFHNLRVNGVFSSSFDAINDIVLKGQQKFETNWVSRSHATELAWCHIAGFAAGLTGLK